MRPVTASLSVRSQLLTPAVAWHLIGRVQSLIGPRPVTSAGLVSSRSCVRLGSNLRAWTSLDLVCLLCIFKCLQMTLYDLRSSLEENGGGTGHLVVVTKRCTANTGVSGDHPEPATLGPSTEPGWALP